MLAGSRLDVISSDCNAYYVTRLEHLTSSLPSSLAAAQQLLPKEASTVAQFLHSASQSVLLPHNHCFGNHTRLHVQYIIQFHMSCFSFTVHIYRIAKCTNLFQHPNYTQVSVCTYACAPHNVVYMQTSPCIVRVWLHSLLFLLMLCVGDSVRTARLPDFK